MRSDHVWITLIVTVAVLQVVYGESPQFHRALPGTNNAAKPRVPVVIRKYDSVVDQDNNNEDKTARVEPHIGMEPETDRSAAYVYSIISSVLVGLSGIFPLLVIPLEAGASLKEGSGAARLKLLLSFAVGSLLGDVFLHLLPEAWATVGIEGNNSHITIGLWVIFGMLSFMCIEKCFGEEDEVSREEEEEEKDETTSKETANVNKNGYNLRSRHTHNGAHNGTENGTKNGAINGKVTNEHSNGNSINHHIEPTEKNEPELKIHITGYLNLLANCIDNFTHGLAVAGSYLISPKVGFCTTVAILLHEIPHEVGDFAILLRSGFDRWKAAQAQILTASGGVLGCLTALSAESAQSAGVTTAWILPFTAGGFIYIALVTVVPDLLQEKSPRESLKQMICIIAGISSMLAVTWLFE